MKKTHLIFLTLLLLTIISFLFIQNKEESNIDDLREQHKLALENSPFKETINLTKEERKAMGLPPNKYFERQWELTMNPALGYPEPYKIKEIQDNLSNSMASRVPGDAGDNAWVERGPNNVGGRTRVVFFDPNDVNKKKVFAGAVSGGLWVTSDITVNGGWAQVSGVPGNLNVSCFTIDPNDSNTWYIGTGEQYTSGQAVGDGVYKTTDGGVNWTNIPVQLAGGGDLSSSNTLFLSGVYYINDIIARNNGGSTELYLGIGAHYYGAAANLNNLLGTQSAGLYRSTDNGTNWTRNESAAFKFSWSGLDWFYIPNDLEISSDNTLWMGTITTPGIGGNGGGRVFKSSNGTTWTQEYQIPTTSNSTYSSISGNRVEVETSTSNASKIYLLVQKSLTLAAMQLDDTTTPRVDIILTTDAFATAPSIVTLPNDPDTGVPANDFTRNQSFYDLVIEADPTNDATVFVGGINIHRSVNSGTNWNTISHWHPSFSTAGSLVHADQHAITFRPGTSSQAVIGHDGGISFANDLTTTGNNLTDIYSVDDDYNVTQFYHMGVAPTTFAANSFLAGAQDNGTPYWSSASPSGPSNSSDISGGDGAFSFFDQVATDYMITNYVYNNSISLWDFSVSAWRTVATNTNNEGDFINPQALDSNLDILYSNGAIGSNYQIFRYEGLTTLTDGIDATRTVLTNAVLDDIATALIVSPHTTLSTTLLIGLENGSLIKVTNADNGSISWSEFTVPFVGSISDIEFGASEAEIFVTMHNYGVTSVWYSSNSGSSWVTKEGNLPDMPIKCILQNSLNTEEVIVGTELGVWRTANFSNVSPSWSQSYNGMSDVKVTHLQLRNDNMVFASTYGRGVYSGQFIAGSLGLVDNDFDNNSTRVFPTVSNGEFSILSKTSLGETDIEIYSINGQKVHNSTFELSNVKKDFNLSLSSGLYLIKLKGNNFEETKRIIIE